MKQTGIILFLCGSLWTSLAHAGGYNVSGKIIKPDGTVFSGTAVPFAIELVNATGACVIYKEEFSVNMADTKGAFHVIFGGPTANRTYPTSGTLTAESALKNTASYTCLDNSTYTPNTTDERSIRITFNDGNTWQIFSQQALKSVPSATSAKYATTADSALSANAVATFQATNLLRSSNSTLPDLTATEAANFQTLLTRFTDIKNIIDGTSSTYLKVAPAETDPTVRGFAKADLPTCAAGYVLTATGPSTLTCVIDAGGGAGATLPAGTNGQFLRFDGTAWVAANIYLPDVSTLTGSLTSLNTNKVDKTSIANCASTETLVYNSVGDNWSCAAINLTGDISGTAAANTVARIRGIAVAGTAPSNGQVLKFNGTEWAPATVSGSGTVTSITAGTGLDGGTITGSGTISLPNTGVTPGTFGGGNYTPTISVDAQGRITALTNNAIAFPISTVAGRGGAVTLFADDFTNSSGKYFKYQPNATACANGQTLVWSTTNTRWECGTPAGSISGITASGNLSGNYPAPTVVAIQNELIDGTGSPSEGDVLTYKNSMWRHAALGCPAGYNKVNKGAPFCILSLGSTTYAAAAASCATTQRANICSATQLIAAKLDAKITISSTVLTDQLTNYSSTIVPVIYNASSDTFASGTFFNASGDGYCCRQQEYTDY